MPAERRNKIKEGLRLLESSLGKDTNHPTMKTGTHEGYSAHGAYGLMPITSQEYAKRLLKKTAEDDSRREKLNTLSTFPLSPENQSEFKQLLTDNPEIEDAIVNKLLDTIERKAGPTEEAAIINWERGQNRAAPSEEEIGASPRVQKYKEYFKSKPIK